jgi:hypothetical protein
VRFVAIQWFSDNNATNSGGVLISGATGMYSPSVLLELNVCVINSSLRDIFTTTVSFYRKFEWPPTASTTPSVSILLDTSYTYNSWSYRNWAATGLPAGSYNSVFFYYGISVVHNSFWNLQLLLSCWEDWHSECYKTV